MSFTPDIAAEQDAGLALLFQAGLELALQVQADAMAAESPEARARLGVAFHRISRGVRQTAALRAKLGHDAGRAEREAAAEVANLEKARVAGRKDQLKATVERLIWTEHEGGDDAEDLKADLEDLLDIEAGDPAFAGEALEVQVARICARLELPIPPPQGEGSAEPTERVEAHPPTGSALQPPQFVPDSSPSGGASADDDDLLSDDPRRSSA